MSELSMYFVYFLTIGKIQFCIQIFGLTPLLYFEPLDSKIEEF